MIQKQENVNISKNIGGNTLQQRKLFCSHSEAIGEDITDAMIEGWIPEALSCFAVSPYDQKCCVLFRKSSVSSSSEWIPSGKRFNF